MLVVPLAARPAQPAALTIVALLLDGRVSAGHKQRLLVRVYMCVYSCSSRNNNSSSNYHNNNNNYNSNQDPRETRCVSCPHYPTTA